MQFKTDKVKSRWEKVHPVLRSIITDGDLYMQEKHKKELMLTETATTLAEDKAVGRTSSTHRSLPWGRAIDVRTSCLSEEEKKDLKDYLLKKYAHLGALVKDDKTGNFIHNLIYDKPHGTGPHLHVQLMTGVPT